MTPALLGTRPKWKAFWRWQDGNGTQSCITKGQGWTDKIYPGEGYLKAPFKFLKVASQSEIRFTSRDPSRGEDQYSGEEVSEFWACYLGQFSNSQRWLSVNYTDLWDTDCPIAEGAHTGVKWTFSEDATEGIIYIRWDVGLIPSKILCKCKILIWYNIK